ncbi:hypothetical protein F4819DRAFT_463521 [Hypoxylon fuscum]|nr:hypothetical protein F4819DRAFT_463521 [Hypoxylon fuscum]
MRSLFFGRPLGAPRFTHHGPTLRRYLSTKYRAEQQPRFGVDRGAKHTQPSAWGGFVQSPTPKVEDVRPGEHVHSVCRKYDIAFPQALSPLKGLKLKGNPFKLAVKTSNRHCVDYSSLKYLDKFEHPFTKSVLNMYIDKKKQSLWYSVHAYPMASAFPCRVATKRLKHAFRDALAAAGYDLEGKRIKIEDESSVIADLYGTVSIGCADPKAVCNIKFADLFEQAKMVLSQIEFLLARNENGKHINLVQKAQKFNKLEQDSKRKSSSNTKTTHKQRPRTDSKRP